MRYRDLIQQALDNGISLREMARYMELPPTSLHNYLNWPTEPRMDALKKMSDYFGEPITVLLSEDDDLTANLVTAVRQLPREEKEELLQQVQKNKVVHIRSIKTETKKQRA